MSDNRIEEMKDKFVGTVKETTGKIFDNEEMELKGKLQKGFGKAREVAGDVVNEMEDVKDKVVGTVKETTGKVTDNRGLELRGKFQKGRATGTMTNKIIMGAGALAGALLVTKAAKKLKENSDERKQ